MMGQPQLQGDAALGGSAAPGIPRFWPLLALVFLVALLIGTRALGDQVRGAGFINAYLSRGAAAGAIAAAPTALLGLLLRRRHALAYPVLVTAAFVFGLAANVALTLVLSTFDPLLSAGIRQALKPVGFVQLHSPGEPVITVRPVASGGYDVREDTVELTELEIGLLLAKEDERFLARTIGIDLKACLRALWVFVRDGRWEGASSLEAQLAGEWLGLNPRREQGWRRIRSKVLKMAAGMRLADLFSRRQILAAYLNSIGFQVIAGRRLVGIAAASRYLYGVDHRELRVSQLAMLMCQLGGPRATFPFPLAGESETKYQARLVRLQACAGKVLENAARGGWITRTEAQQATQELWAGMRGYAEVRHALNRPRLPDILREVGGHVPDHIQRTLRVHVAVDRNVQARLMQAVQEAHLEISAQGSARAHWNLYPDDELLIDAVILSAEGAVVAHSGDYVTAGQIGSVGKIVNAHLAMNRGTIRSIDDPAGPRTRVPVKWAIARSLNPPNEELAERNGFERLAERFREEGCSVTGAFRPIILGAGVDCSLQRLAAVGLQFGYRGTPGCQPQPRLVARIEDAATGALLYEPKANCFGPPQHAVAVREAMEMVPLNGTARRLREQATEAALAVKTGSNGFRRRGSWLGSGGSLILAVDSVTGWSIAVRASWRSRLPFEPEGAQSALFVVKHLLPMIRNYGGEL
jgi:membrane peptidoglycan carboxypeptidase